MLRITPKWLEHPTHGPTQRRLTRQPHWPVGQSRTAVADLDSGLPVGFQPSPSQEKDTSNLPPFVLDQTQLFPQQPCRMQGEKETQMAGLTPRQNAPLWNAPPNKHLNFRSASMFQCFCHSHLTTICASWVTFSSCSIKILAVV